MTNPDDGPIFGRVSAAGAALNSKKVERVASRRRTRTARAKRGCQRTTRELEDSI
jgi:hypothetical protein